MAATEIAFRPLQNLLLAALRWYPMFGSRHTANPPAARASLLVMILSARPLHTQHAADAPRVACRDRRSLAQIAFPLTRFLGQNMAPVRLRPLDLAGSRDAEAFVRGSICL